MELIKWDESLSVQNYTIDKQHSKLVSLINQLHSAMSERKASEVIDNVLDELVKYVDYHFSYEEKLLKKHNYPQLPEQEKEHRAFVKKLEQFVDKPNAGKALISIQVIRFLQEWIVNHIKGIDKKYSDFLISKGEK